MVHLTLYIYNSHCTAACYEDADADVDAAQG